MIKALSLLVAVSAVALAGSASAASMKVSVVGKDAATIHADIVRAAKSVCYESLRVDTLGPVGREMDACVADTVKAAEAQLAPVAQAATNQKLASSR